jgi:hypothetical protein
MQILSATTDKLQVITSASCTLDVKVSYVDDVIESAGPPRVDIFNADRQLTAITTATTTDILAAPSSTVKRNVKFISLRNKHASTSVDVTVQFNANATLYEEIKCTLLAGEELICREGVWFHYDTSGGVYGQQLPTASDTVVGGIQVAVQSDMETATSVTTAVTPGRQHYHPSAAKAWVSCGVAADIQQSYNITSLTDTGTGIVTITINVDFAAATYCVVAQVEMTGTTYAVASAREVHIRSATRATGSVALDCIDDTATTELVKDPTTYHCVMYGDLP